MFSVQLKQLFLDLVFIFLEDPLLSSIFPATLLAAALSAFDGIFGDVQLVFFCHHRSGCSAPHLRVTSCSG